MDFTRQQHYSHEITNMFTQRSLISTISLSQVLCKQPPGLLLLLTWGPDRVGVPDLSVSGDNFDLVEDDPHDPTMTSEPEAPMQSLNQLPVVTDLVDARSA
jgi:hypothetical protein